MYISVRRVISLLNSQWSQYTRRVLSVFQIQGILGSLRFSPIVLESRDPISLNFQCWDYDKDPLTFVLDLKHSLVMFIFHV